MALIQPSLRINDNYNGIITSNISFEVCKNSNDTTPLHYTAYAAQLEIDGKLCHGQNWQSSGEFLIQTYNQYGKKVKIIGKLRDAYGNIQMIESQYFTINHFPQVVDPKINIEGNGEINNPNKKYSRKIKISWTPVTDKDNHSIKYGLDYKENDDVGQFCAHYDSETSVTIDLTDKKFKKTWGGELIKKLTFSLRAFDMISPDGKTYEYNDYHTYEKSNIYTPVTIYLKTILDIPSPPSNISPRSQHFEDAMTLSWDSAKGAIKYEVELIKYSTGNVLKSFTTDKTEITVKNLKSLFDRGEEFIFNLRSIDEDNLVSKTARSPLYWINRPPKKVRTLKINSSDLNFEDTVPLSWTKSYDPDGDSISYYLQYKIDSEKWSDISSGQNLSENTTSLNHNIQNIKEGSSISYRIRVKESKANLYSEWTYLDGNDIRKNSSPTEPILIYPNVKLKLYEKRPRFVIKMGIDPDGDKQILNVLIDNINYNSLSNKELFSKENIGNNDIVMFIPSVDLNRDSRIYIYSEDIHHSKSMKTQCLLNFEQYPIKNFESNTTKIKKSLIIEFRNIINLYREYYDLKLYEWETSIVQLQTIIPKKCFKEMEAAIKDVSEKINSYTTKSYQKRFNNKTVDDEFVTTRYLNNILDILKNI